MAYPQGGQPGCAHRPPPRAGGDGGPRGAKGRTALKHGEGDDEKYVGGTADKTSDGESIKIGWDDGGGTGILDWIGDHNLP
ncbi:hypothetical protein [Streptomyces sp. CNQ085]|uniref:hypothetical protein n=1 Tax=Streptomyces sp. CNQ085 TaxID=2886944 RepID=UPI001F5155EF|nr:hypothetical protein [Streptomyces sp. CNQ085]MCI0384936.1 hypothetical protein [Streptomyces sp. CNQ085]